MRRMYNRYLYKFYVRCDTSTVVRMHEHYTVLLVPGIYFLLPSIFTFSVPVSRKKKILLTKAPVSV